MGFARSPTETFLTGRSLTGNEQAYLRMAAVHGITIFFYPADGWTIGHSFVPQSIEQCYSYGRKVAERFRDLPASNGCQEAIIFPAPRIWRKEAMWTTVSTR